MVKKIRYRHLNDLFSLLMAPTLLFSFNLVNSSVVDLMFGFIVIILNFGFIGVISYKIVNVKNPS